MGVFRRQNNISAFSVFGLIYLLGRIKIENHLGCLNSRLRLHEKLQQFRHGNILQRIGRT